MPVNHKSATENGQTASTSSSLPLAGATQEELNAIALESLAPVSAVVGALYLVFAASHMILLEPPASVIMTVLALSTAIAGAALFITARNNVIQPNRAHVFIFFGCLLVLVNSAMHLLMTQDPQQSTNFFLLLVGVGLFYGSTRWFIATYALIGLTWFALPSHVMGQEDFLHYSYMMFVSSLVGATAFVTRMRNNKNLIALRNKYKAGEKQLEEALGRIQLGVAAERDSKAKSEFLASLSHELRAPLNAIVGFSEIMIHELFGKIGNDQYKKYLQNIMTSSQHLLHLVNDIMDLSKIDAHMEKQADTVIDVDRVGNSCLTIMSERAARKQVSIGYVEDDDVKAIYTDEQRLKQILTNLLSNAIKFTPSGGVVWLKVGQDREKGIFFSVRDTGVGMTDEELEMAITPFWQGHTDSVATEAPEDEEPTEGTGLGLALSREFAKMLGGSLSLNSAPGAGTTATLWLPTGCLLDSEVLVRMEMQEGDGHPDLTSPTAPLDPLPAPVGTPASTFDRRSVRR